MSSLHRILEVSGNAASNDKYEMTINDRLPKSIQCLRDYNRQKFFGDTVAGITVGLVALPLAMAFAIASGVSPQAGTVHRHRCRLPDFTSGGSSTQIGGPTGAFVVVVYGIVAKYGMDGLYMCTLMAGVILVILGVTGLGNAVKYIPRPVVVGFTNGIAVHHRQHANQGFLRTAQSKKFPANSSAAWRPWLCNFHTSLAGGHGARGFIDLRSSSHCMRFVKRVPGYIVALFRRNCAGRDFRLPVETIGTRFGGIPRACHN